MTTPLLTTSSKFIITDLDEEHQQLLVRAVTNVIANDIAQETFAQIIDGLPRLNVLFDTHFYSPHVDSTNPDHPCLDHENLCDGVLEETREFFQSFDACALQFESPLFLSFKAAPPKSRLFNTRLIEMVVVSIHQIAVMLYQLGTGGNRHRDILDWAPPKENNDLWWRQNPNGPPPTIFYHGWYREYERYPNGAADMAAYWAEGRIFGGVVLFDRKTEGCHDIYIHPDREKLTYRICKLLDRQKNDLLEFLLAEPTSPVADFLPIRPDNENRQRVDPEEAIERTGIYRDLWERGPRDLDEPDIRSRDVFSARDWVSSEEWNESRYRWRTRFQRYGYDDE